MTQIIWTSKGCLTNSPPECHHGGRREAEGAASLGSGGDKSEWEQQGFPQTKAIPSHGPAAAEASGAHPEEVREARATHGLPPARRPGSPEQRTRGLTPLHLAPSLLPKGRTLPGKSPSWCWQTSTRQALVGCREPCWGGSPPEQSARGGTRYKGGEIQSPNCHSPRWVSRCLRILSKESAPKKPKKRSVFQPWCIIWIKMHICIPHPPPPQVKVRSKDYTLVFLFSQ